MELDFNISPISLVLAVNPKIVSLLNLGLLLDFSNWTGSEHLVGDLNVEERVFHGLELLSSLVKLSPADDNLKISKFSLFLFDGS